MAERYIRLFLTTGTRCRNVETDKAYAIKDYKVNVFIPKKHCVLQELENNEHYRWALDIPMWLAMKSEKISDAIMYIQELNEWRENGLQKQMEEGLELINKYLEDN